MPSSPETRSVFIFAHGAGKVREADAAVGGIRALPIEATDENLAVAREALAGGFPSPKCRQDRTRRAFEENRNLLCLPAAGPLHPCRRR